MEDRGQGEAPGPAERELGTPARATASRRPGPTTRTRPGRPSCRRRPGRQRWACGAVGAQAPVLLASRAPSSEPMPPARGRGSPTTVG